MENAVEPGKIFVGGLSWETTKEGLTEYFSKYGEVSDAVIMMDPISKKPRGFGFVMFTDPACVKDVVESGPHEIDNKTVDPKPASVKGHTENTQQAGVGVGVGVKKIFVGGLHTNTSEDEVRTYFSQYGSVSEVDLKFDKETQRMRGFGFVGFEDETTVEKICQIHFHQINGKTVEAKKAQPRNATTTGTGAKSGSVYPHPQGSQGQYTAAAAAYTAAAYSGYSPQQIAAYQQYAQSYPSYYGGGAYGGGGTDRYGNAQQTSVSSQQYGQDASSYGTASSRSGYGGTEGYAGQSTGYSYDSTQAAAQTAAAYQQTYGDAQAGSNYSRQQQQQPQQQRSYYHQ